MEPRTCQTCPISLYSLGRFVFPLSIAERRLSGVADPGEGGAGLSPPEKNPLGSTPDYQAATLRTSFGSIRHRRRDGQSIYLYLDI